MTATASIAVTSSWAATSVTGQAKINLQNIGVNQVTYFVGTNTPSSDYVGAILSPTEMPHPVDLASGETLYVKGLNGKTEQLRAVYAL